MKAQMWLELLLVGWFVLLAIGELVCRRSDDGRPYPGDRRLLTNFALTSLGFTIGGILPLAKIGSSLVSVDAGIGLSHSVQIPWVALLAATFLLDSFSTYWVHRLMHVTPLLWRVHRVHHADCEVDVSTSFRNHPLELLITVPTSALVIILIGATPSVIMISQTLFMAAAIWQHADIHLPSRLENILALAIVTPRLHRLHHNQERRVHDSNFGDSIILWDRLFGTLTIASECAQVGLREQRARPDHLFDQIWSPLYSG